MSVELAKDYQDQSEWYEIKIQRCGVWVTIADVDTYEEAEEEVKLMKSLDQRGNYDVRDYRIKRVHGIDEMDCS